MIRVSVVVPTYRRPDLLDRCLAALAGQSLAPGEYEIVVADDAAELPGAEETRRLVESYRRPGLAVSYVGVRGRHGPAAARNHGWRAAGGAIIAFTDDDTIPDPNWLLEGARALLGDGSGTRLAVTGQTLVPIPEVPTDYERNESGLARAEFITANCFCRRAALEKIGGFDENFTMAWREDSDLHFRLLSLGGNGAVGRAPRALVVHPVRPAPWGVCLKQAKKAMFNALLYKKHPRLYRERIQKTPPWRYHLKIALLAAALAGVARNRPSFAAGAALAWFALVFEFSLRRLRGTSRDPRHVAEMLITSVLLPPVAVFWRLYGAVKFRVAFI